jgi:hypothetical protein
MSGKLVTVGSTLISTMSCTVGTASAFQFGAVSQVPGELEVHMMMFDGGGGGASGGNARFAVVVVVVLVVPLPVESVPPFSLRSSVTLFSPFS